MGLAASRHVWDLLEWGSNPCALNWQVDSYLLLYLKGSPRTLFIAPTGVDLPLIPSFRIPAV